MNDGPVRVTQISVRNFLGLEETVVDIDRPLTVVTGANGTGKSTLIQALNLVHVVSKHGAMPYLALEDEWAGAAYGGGETFEVRAGMRFDQVDERKLIDAYYRGAVLGMLHPSAGDPIELAALVDERLQDCPAEPLLAGEFVVLFDSRRRTRWVAGWQFDLPSGPAHVQLLGRDVGNIVHGPVRFEVGQLPYVRELAASTNDIYQKVHDGSQSVDLWNFVAGRRVNFVLEEVGQVDEQPVSIAHVLQEVEHRSSGRVGFIEVIGALIIRRIQVTDNHRSSVRTQFQMSELAGVPDLRDGSMVAAELYRLKNGSADDRRRFQVVQSFFRRLVGDSVECSAFVECADGENVALSVSPVVGAGVRSYEVPLFRSGAGASEALLLAAVLADERRCVFLDEPAVHLSPTAQRRLLAILRERADGPGQTAWITHNPDLVPVRNAVELSSIVRLARIAGGHTVNSPVPSGKKDSARMTRLLAASEARSLLFAAGVVLVEGETDYAALVHWLDGVGVSDERGPLPTPDERNVLFLAVNGHKAFGAVADLASRLGVPWAIVADGPAMRPGSDMAQDLETLGRAVPQGGKCLSDVVGVWASAGVFTLAQEFGDDGSKRGEIEEFLARLNSEMLDQVRRDVGARKGSRVGAAFAASVPVPLEVAKLWGHLLNALGIPR
jgi:predicted ATPase